MRAHNHADLVLLQELVNDIGSIAHDVVRFVGVADRVCLHAQCLV